MEICFFSCIYLSNKKRGRPVILPTNMSSDVKKSVDDGWLKNAFNQYASDLISIHRSLPDPRDPW